MATTEYFGRRNGNLRYHPDGFFQPVRPPRERARWAIEIRLFGFSFFIKRSSRWFGARLVKIAKQGPVIRR